MSEQDLDTRIRTLVALAVADAPPAPDLDDGSVFEPRRQHHGHRRRWVGGGVGLLAAAAALITVTVLVADTDDRISTPATVPTTVPAPATTLPETARQPTTPEPTTPTTELLHPTPAPLPVGAVEQRLVTAGRDGVVVRDLDGNELQRLDQPARRALPVGDGRVLVELGTPDDASWSLVLWNPDGTTTDPFGQVSLVGPVTIHDIAVFDGRPTLLYDIDPSANPEPDATLYVAPITAEGIDIVGATEIDVVSAPEYGVTGLTLASNGLIVGEAQSDGVSSLWVRGVPGTRGEQLAGELTVGRLGLDETYNRTRCDLCPSGFTTDGTGELIAWVDAGDLVVRRVEDGTEVRRTPLGEVANDYPDLDLEGDTVVVSYGLFGTKRPALVRPDGTTTTLAGFTADIGPGIGGDATPTEAPRPTVDPIALVTAGPDGVGVFADAETEVRRLDQPAEVAFATPGGSVIFQPARNTPDGTPGDPLIWRADGTTDRLLGALPAGQSYWVYDVANISGVAAVLYGVRTVPADGNPAGYNEALHALSMRPGGWVVDDLGEISTWEGGYSLLSLSDTGLVVGETGESVSHGLFSVTLPGSPAETTGPLSAAAVGLRNLYGDEPSPRSFGISPDGAVVAWVEASQIVIHDLATGAEVRNTYPDLESLAVRGVDVRGSEVVLNSGWPGSDEGTAAVVLLVQDGGDPVIEKADATFASLAP